MIPGEKELERREKKFRFIGWGALIVVLLVPFILALASRGDYLVKNAEGKFFRVRLIFLAGDYALGLKGTDVHDTRALALAGVKGRDLSGFSLGNAEFMEVIREEPEEESAAVLPAFRYAGNYRMSAAGHKGYLYLRDREGRPYGTVKFPGWGKGVNEPLKSLAVKGRHISFVRSVTTEAERKRIGAPSLFIQNYFGQFSGNGRFVRGHFVRAGTRYAWSAEKVK